MIATESLLRPCILALVLITTACASITPPPPEVDSKSGGLEIALRSAEMQMIVFQTPDDVDRFCIAPAPDAVPVVNRQLSLGAQGETVGGTSDRGADVLGGRVPAILMARELLYRTCELSLNYRLEKAEALALYQATLAMIERITPALSGASGGGDTKPTTTNDE